MLRTFKFRLYPSKAQSIIFEQTLETCRVLYNNALEERKNAWENERKSTSYREQQNNLPKLKSNKSSLQSVHSQVLQDVLHRLDQAFHNFFRRVKAGEKPGYPRFKAVNRFDSFTYPQFGNGAKFRDRKLWLSKVGEVNIKLHRGGPFNGWIKNCTIRHDVDRWFVCFTVGLPDTKLGKREIKTAVGVDLGVTNLVALSTGELIENPRWLKHSEERLAVAQRWLSCKKGSKNREKQRLKVARLHRKIRCQRADFFHKLSRKLVDSYDLIVFEKLNIAKMIQNSYAAKCIVDAAWRQLVLFTQYKAEEAGAVVQFVDAANTSQQCSSCSTLVPKDLSERLHACPACGLVLNRDLNAARNILMRNTVGLTGRACGSAALAGC
ncbi:IS200/IS605 family element transposase accessory protein TnpB [Candidatus Micrarchaeota archaeon]|nr:IS200/IS605 family element transposase accessory protein TnpB [Candidatus Micrarchaeota archaeon]